MKNHENIFKYLRTTAKEVEVREIDEDQGEDEDEGIQCLLFYTNNVKMWRLVLLDDLHAAVVKAAYQVVIKKVSASCI